MIPVLLVDAGFFLAFLGCVSLIKPLRFLRIRSRARGALVLLVGIVVAGIGMALPAAETRVAEPRSELDRFLPVYQFAERHTIEVAAPRERVYRAIREVTAPEIRGFQTLTWIRRFGRPGRESILNSPEDRPLLDVALNSGFLLLSEEPEREIVFGTPVIAPPGWRSSHVPTPEDFKSLRSPGFAWAVMNFSLEEAGPGVYRVTTETRVFATDAVSRRKFARYWRVIYPGSALIRRMWLEAVKERAEKPASDSATFP